jgi:ubiquinone/menaquinone biosynthesis C-methylase UbiE
MVSDSKDPKLADNLPDRDRPTSYDQQAPDYDRRVGLPSVACQEIVQAMLSIAKTQPDDLVLEVGTGTGQIGEGFASTPLRYLGFDLSNAMLNLFRQRLSLHENYRMTLVQADGNDRWPVPGASTRLIFSSRAIHLLDLDHVAREIARVTRPDGTVLLLGKIQRPKDSVKTLMKQAMQDRLRQQGFQGRQGDKSQHQLIDLCCQQGGEALEPLKVSQWRVTYSPRQSIEAWRNKSGLAGIDPPLDIKNAILEDLATWAKATFGNLDRPIESKEHYVLQGVWLR